ncbi:MAG: hypothetical protein QOK37_1663 [Thermoanaerobaculia bacterium]|jgi:GT2 family glycosyltransferase|nr:hypothetical protein [Thermoanaerobaculia bacterium]
MCSIVVPVYQDPAILDLFLESLWATVELQSHLILINDGSGAETQRTLESWASRPHSLLSVEIAEHQTSLGAAVARNEALRHTRGDLIFFADSDLVLLRGWQNALIDGVIDEPRVGCVGAVLLYPQSGGIQHCGIVFSSDIGRHLYLNARPEILDNHCFDVQAVAFALCAITREAIEAVGDIDELFFNAYEDFDYVLRLRSHGFRVVVQPRACAYHWERRNGRHRNANQKRHLGRFWRTWGNDIEPDLPRFLSRRIQTVAMSLPPTAIIGFDLCEDRGDCALLWETFARNGLGISSVQDLSYCVNGSDLWLPPILGRDAHRRPERFVFAVDNFVQLLGNHYWGELRRQHRDDDLVVDLYGNVVLFRDIACRAWPGSKVR